MENIEVLSKMESIFYHFYRSFIKSDKTKSNQITGGKPSLRFKKAAFPEETIGLNNNETNTVIASQS